MSTHKRFPLHTAALVALAVLWLPAIAGAAAVAGKQPDRLTELQQKLDQSLKMIEALAARVHELEAKQPATAAAAAAANPATPGGDAPEARLDAVEQKVSQIEVANATRRSDDNGVALHGFADVGIGTYNPTSTGVKGFNVGNLDFYLTPRLGERTRALFELNNEVGSDGGVGVDLERAQIGYQFSDRATVWLGRFHTPYGYVNTALHHGGWVTTALRRPKFLQFEDAGGIVPAHTVGLWVTGGMHTATGKVLYDAYVGNAQLIQDGVIDMRNAGNAHGHLIAGGRVGYQFGGAADGLTVGLHAFSARIDDDLVASNATRVLSYGAYLVYDTDRWEHMAELYLFDDRDLTGATGNHSSTAGFVQLGYRAPWGVPYLRYERTSLDQADQYFLQQESGGSYYRGALGTRFDIDPKSALKFEFANTHLTDRLRDQYSEALVQYAIRF